MFYNEGTLVPQDTKKAIYYFELASKNNFADADYTLGQIYYQNKNFPRNIKKAIYHFELASKNNISDALLMLGKIYLKGEQIPRDFHRAFYYIQLASNLDNTLAYYHLGRFYYKGKYTPRDVKKALYYFDLASKDDVGRSHYFLGIIYLSIPDFINLRKAIYHLEISAKKNDLNTIFSLGLIYFNSENLQKIATSYQNYLLLPIHTKQLIMPNILSLYFLKEKKYEMAKKFLTSEKYNEPHALNNLGVISYFHENNFEKVIYYLNRSSKEEFALADFNLAMIYEIENRIDISFDHYYRVTSLSQNKTLISQVFSNDTIIILAFFSALKIHYYSQFTNISIDKKKYESFEVQRILKLFPLIHIIFMKIFHIFKFDITDKRNLEQVLKEIMKILLTTPYLFLFGFDIWEPTNIPQLNIDQDFIDGLNN
ncbi:hypothetical protein TRFO_37498 [Tritrichomonas foetus]|uniref:TPR repeat protein n=1 Tax=Tritrichomonas foetus TaxID=1144522 RepID=A0A1J4JFG3_9EUKA|nr:hypothetical protein TRFO_37498 [Tritrichomonas foetus]|eukprot:OHS96387.1 hypothetical protein TRFO_37498 [Tritrichomonas foetus]